MSDRVDPCMQAMKVASRHPSPDRIVVDPDRNELTPANHPMLPRGDPCQPHIRVCAENLAPRASFVLHTPSVAGGVLRRGALCEGIAGQVRGIAAGQPAEDRGADVGQRAVVAGTAVAAVVRGTAVAAVLAGGGALGDAGQ